MHFIHSGYELTAYNLSKAANFDNDYFLSNHFKLFDEKVDN
jgi:hypothetical protein